MALIKCPECGKEVSDKSRECIYCGCPLSNALESKKATQQVEIASLDIKGKNLKKTVISIVIILGVVVGGLYGYNLVQTRAEEAKKVQQTNEYIDTLVEV